MKYRMRKWLVGCVLIIALCWPVYQLFKTANTPPKRDAVQLLYQVSLFQVELLHSLWGEAAAAKSTDQLQSLKQAAYSAAYTHERLVLAVGEGELAPLESYNELLQFIVRMQIGGDRPLKAAEADALHQSYELYRQLFDAYAMLFSSGGRVVPSANKKISDLDQRIHSLIRERLRS